MNSSEVRKSFLNFFKGKDHRIVPSDSLVPSGDPTLLFTGAGMNQFKEYFLGVKKDMRRAVSCQKCFRTGDVEQVGQTPSHLTFFEMLGNFSFGDYFKEEAIQFGWEFMTEVLGLPKDRLWASVYDQDEEAAGIWKGKIGLAEERIVRFGPKENFWPSDAPAHGPNGPCGPCSEIYYDYGRCMIGRVCPDLDRCEPGCSCGRFVEVWNLVFTQFDRQPDGSLKDLPSRNIDTGMGLERLTAVLQDKMSVFETDLFEPIVEEMVHLLRDEVPDRISRDQRASVYTVADHIRALTLLIADGVVPSNDGRGYVLRMLLRRAVRQARTFGLEKPFLYRLVPVVVQNMQEAYPELTDRRESISKTVLTEEERFLNTLEEKIPLLVAAIGSQGSAGGTQLEAETAARFYDTHGLSYEEIVQTCQERKVAVPSREAFDQALERLQAKSKAESRFGGEVFSKDELVQLIHQVARETRFIEKPGLTHALSAKVVGLIQGNRLVREAQAPAKLGVILDLSPFYGEAGGQVGDTGILKGPEGELRVADTQRVGRILFHDCELIKGKIQTDDSVEAKVDQQRRHRISQNHTATHLLQAALRHVLGTHVVQAGSLVASDHLRFDFAYPRALTTSQKRSVESLVNEWIEAGLVVSMRQMSLHDARKAGALALFGERYGEQVRVVSIADSAKHSKPVSLELCGGTHLGTSSEVGFLTIVEEGSVAAGMRRVKALSNQEARASCEERLVSLREEEDRLKKVLGERIVSPKKKSTSGKEAPKKKLLSARKLLKVFEEEWEQRQRQIEELKKKLKDKEAGRKRVEVSAAYEKAQTLLEGGIEIGFVNVIAQHFDQQLDHESLRILSDGVRKREKKAVIFLMDQRGFCVASSNEIAQKEGVSANEMLKIGTKVAGGSGGGHSQLAQGKIKDPSKFKEVQEQLLLYIKDRVKSSQ